MLIINHVDSGGTNHPSLTKTYFLYSTIDAIFILESFISKTLRYKKKLYIYWAFVDLKGAFDSVYRNGLWYKMVNSGLDGKLFHLIRSIYLDVKSCVKSMNSLSEFFDSNIRLLQVLSSSLFWNDLELHLQQSISAGLTLDQQSIYLLMFADDAVVFRKGGKLSRNENWTFAGEEIEIVNSFNYLGMVLSSGGT